MHCAAQHGRTAIVILIAWLDTRHSCYIWTETRAISMVNWLNTIYQNSAGISGFYIEPPIVTLAANMIEITFTTHANIRGISNIYSKLVLCASFVRCNLSECIFSKCNVHCIAFESLGWWVYLQYSVTCVSEEIFQSIYNTYIYIYSRRASISGLWLLVLQKQT